MVAHIPSSLLQPDNDVARFLWSCVDLKIAGPSFGKEGHEDIPTQ